jgi:squalene-hopene/tetraprenyl-beta-curcumene cyclase
MNGKYGIGGIFPAMVNVYESLIVLPYSKDAPERKLARQAIDALLTQRGDTMYCQPCVSPIWDTALVSQALIETEYKQPVSTEIEAALNWLKKQQLSDEPGDWRIQKPALTGGGWAFQYSNYYYPDLDDTSMVAWVFFFFIFKFYSEPNPPPRDCMPATQLAARCIGSE